MNCPEHSEVELREERTAINGRTGFCLLCLKHYLLCRAVHYMASCDRIAGHEGAHKTKKGKNWIGEDKNGYVY